MRLDVITLFPELVTVPMGTSIMRRAQEKQTIQLGVHDLREFGIGKHRQVDDTPCGGGRVWSCAQSLFSPLSSA